MPPKRVDWIDRIRQVEREFVAIRLGARRLLADTRSDRGILDNDALRPRDVEYAAARCEGTCIIRLFAEFETGLRSCWAAIRGSGPPARTRDLIDGMAALRQIPDAHRDSIHEIVSASSLEKDAQTLRNLYWRAGITEYWLVDGRNDPLSFTILQWRSTGYSAARKQAGWSKSRVFNRSFQLTCRLDDMAKPDYHLSVR